MGRRGARGGEREEWTGEGERKACGGTLVFIPTSAPKWRFDEEEGARLWFFLNLYFRFFFF